MRRLSFIALIVLASCGPSKPPIEGNIDYDINHEVYRIKTKDGMVITRKSEEGYLYIPNDGPPRYIGPNSPEAKNWKEVK